MATALEELSTLLDLEPIEVNIFRGVSPQETRQRVFGGQVLAQALIAAGRTVEPDRFVHSFHSYFLRPGDPTTPILYSVDRSRDGKSFTTRRVVAIQHGRQIFHMQASFQVAELGLEYQHEMPDVIPPDQADNWIEKLSPYAEKYPEKLFWLKRDQALEFAYGSPISPESGEPQDDRWYAWCRTTGTLPDSPILHSAIAAYAADMVMLETAQRPLGIGWLDSDLFLATIDHAMWFHRPLRADQWLLFDLMSPSASGARGFAISRLFSQSGSLVASMAQEGLMRPPRA